jgi:hypothetical protein
VALTPWDDTAPDAAALQLEAWRRLGSERRLELAMALSDEIREVALAGIRKRHPAYSQERAVRALHRLVLGDMLVGKVWPGEPLVDP